jgi:hypothetical protein
VSLRGWLETQRPLVFHVFVFERAKFVPESETSGDDYSNENADQKKQAVGRESDQQNGDDGDRKDEPGRSFYTETEPGLVLGGHLRMILARLSAQEMMP